MRTADDVADHLATVLASELNDVEPLETITRPSSGKPINRFLSQETIDAKQERRRLERYWEKIDLTDLLIVSVMDQQINSSVTRGDYFNYRITNLSQLQESSGQQSNTCFIHQISYKMGRPLKRRAAEPGCMRRDHRRETA